MCFFQYRDHSNSPYSYVLKSKMLFGHYGNLLQKDRSKQTGSDLRSQNRAPGIPSARKCHSSTNQVYTSSKAERTSTSCTSLWFTSKDTDIFHWGTRLSASETYVTIAVVAPRTKCLQILTVLADES